MIKVLHKSIRTSSNTTRVFNSLCNFVKGESITTNYWFTSNIIDEYLNICWVSINRGVKTYSLSITCRCAVCIDK